MNRNLSFSVRENGIIMEGFEIEMVFQIHLSGILFLERKAFYDDTTSYI